MHHSIRNKYFWACALACTVLVQVGGLAAQDEARVILYGDRSGLQRAAWSVEHTEWQYGIAAVVPFSNVDLQEDGSVIEGPSASPQSLVKYIDVDVVEYFFFDFGNNIEGLYSAYPINSDYIVQLIESTGNAFEIATSFRERASLPMLQTFINEWVSNQLAFDPSSSHLLHWNEFSTGQSGDQIVIEAEDITGSRSFELILNHSATSVEIPAGTFQEGDEIQASITFIYNTNESLLVSPSWLGITATGGDISRMQTSFKMIADSNLVELFGNLAFDTITVNRATQQVHLKWKGNPSLSYSILKNSVTPYTLTGWETIAEDITCESSEDPCSHLLPMAPDEPKAFYQLVATKLPAE